MQTLPIPKTLSGSLRLLARRRFNLIVSRPALSTRLRFADLPPANGDSAWPLPKLTASESRLTVCPASVSVPPLGSGRIIWT
jgi:hypothetical protein